MTIADVLYILHYLLHARDHYPAIYKDLLANTSFRRAFNAADTAYAALPATAADLEPTIHAFARTHNLHANVSAGQLTFDGSPSPSASPTTISSSPTSEPSATKRSSPTSADQTRIHDYLLMPSHLGVRRRNTSDLRRRALAMLTPKTQP